MKYTIINLCNNQFALLSKKYCCQNKTNIFLDETAGRLEKIFFPRSIG
jgi:hypothetical protein